MVDKIFIAIFGCLLSFMVFSQSNSIVVEKELEVAIGIDTIENVDFDFNPKVVIGSEQLLKLILVPQKREMIFRGVKPGKTTVTVRDNLGDVRLRYTVTITSSGKSNVVAELRELIGDVEGLDISIKGGRVFVGGEIVVPEDIGRVSKVLASYPEVMAIFELSPQTQRVIARKMSDELARNDLKDVSVRIVNKTFWLEGVVGSKGKKDLAMSIAQAYLPPKIKSTSADDQRFSQIEKPAIVDFIAVNEKKEPQPAPKMVKIVTQFVELSKSYDKVFAFKWAPMMGADESSIQIGQKADGTVSSTSSSTLSAAISNLFPKLNAAKSAGYARVIQSAMAVTRDQMQATINKSNETPNAIGEGEGTRVVTTTIGLTMSVTPRILEQENIELALNFTVNLSDPTSSAASTNNSISTNLVVKSKESAAIGGVVQNQSATAYDRNDPAPQTAEAGGQPAAPLFKLMRSKNYVTSKSQYVMFVTPEIIESASVGTEEIRKKFRRRE